MRDFLKKALDLTKPYRFRFALGLLCGFLSGALAPTLALSLKLAVDAVFPQEQTKTSRSSVSQDLGTGQVKESADRNTNSNPLATAPDSKGRSAKKKPGQSIAGISLPAPAKKLLEKMGDWFAPPEHPSTLRLVLVIGLIPTSMFLRSLLGYLNTYLLSWVGIRAANDLRVQLFQHLMNLPLQFFNRSSTGDLMTRIENAMAVNSTIKDCFGVMIREPITVIGVVVSLITLEPLLSLYTLLIFPFCLVPIIVFGRKFRKSDSGIHGKFANLSKVMHESFTGMRVIKGYNLELLVVEEFRRATNGLTSFFMRAVRAGELPGPLIEFIGSLGVALVFAYFAFISKEKAQASEMFAYFLLVFSLYAPLKNLSRLNHQLALARLSIDPVYQLLELHSTLPEPAQPQKLKAHNAVIRFENVGFSYGEKPVLHDINLTIQPGQFVALVGRTGSGKTSIANLLLRFYDPQAGGIFIGDTDIRTISSRDLRAHIAVVTQETILFNDTIGQNIALGRPGATVAEIEDAAKHAYAHEFIVEKPKKYETHVGEKGVNISGGQRQRIAIARAILRNAPILVLDEATNALDAEAERIVQTALEELMKGRTTICIAHRLSTIQNADLIVVLDGGRIVETGTHEQLMQARGLYWKFFQLPSDSPSN